MAHFVGTDMTCRNNQSVYGNVTMAIPNDAKDFRLVSDYLAVSATIE